MVTPAAFELSGRVAIVTGAGSPDGIGFATARLLGQLGAAVAIGATTNRVHDRVAELRAAGVDAVGTVGDLTREDAADELVRTARDRWGAVDVVVNNAGMVSAADPDYQEGSIDTMSLRTWRASLERNLDSAFLVSRAAVPGMVARGWGRVVMVASVTGPVMAMRGDVVYAAAKAGLVGLARALAVDVAPGGVTVNAVAPGWVQTGSQTVQERLEGLSTPVGRSGTPEEVASAIVWLATPGASYVTGQCVVVDGGNAIAEERSVR